MNIKDMSAEQVSAVVHSKVMGKEPESCVGGEINVIYGQYWRCSCGWISESFIGDGNMHEEHNKPIPHYTESMDAAWLVVEKMLARQEEEYYLEHFTWRGPQFKPSFEYLTHEGYPMGTTCWHVYLCVNDYCQHVCAKTPQEAICKAALVAVGAIDKDGNVQEEREA